MYICIVRCSIGVLSSTGVIYLPSNLPFFETFSPGWWTGVWVQLSKLHTTVGGKVRGYLPWRRNTLQEMESVCVGVCASARADTPLLRDRNDDRNRRVLCNIAFWKHNARKVLGSAATAAAAAEMRTFGENVMHKLEVCL